MDTVKTFTIREICRFLQQCAWVISSKYDATELGNELSTFRRKE